MNNYDEEENRNKKWCSYCHDEIVEGDAFIKIKGKYYHYSKTEPLLNCYFPGEDEE